MGIHVGKWPESEHRGKLKMKQDAAVLFTTVSSYDCQDFLSFIFDTSLYIQPIVPKLQDYPPSSPSQHHKSPKPATLTLKDINAASSVRHHFRRPCLTHHNKPAIEHQC